MRSGVVRTVVMGVLAVAAVGVVALVVTPRNARERPAMTADGSATRDDRLLELQLVPLEGSPPPFTLDALGGGRVSLGDFRGRPVLIYFWASW